MKPPWLVTLSYAIKEKAVFLTSLQPRPLTALSPQLNGRGNAPDGESFAKCQEAF